MKTIALEELDERNGYLIDMGSTLDLFRPPTDNFLRGAGQWNAILDLWHRENGRLPGSAWETVVALSPPHVQHAIEIMVTADELAIDAVLLEDGYPVLGFDLSEAWVCQKGILVAADLALKTRQLVRNELMEFHSDLVSRFGTHPGLFHEGDRRCHDHGSGLLPMSCFEHSYEHPLRALYYLRLSEVSKVHCFLSEAKRNYIEDLRVSAKVVPDPHDEVRKAVLAELGNPDDLLPPVAEIVLLHALDSGKSPGDALVDVRNSTEAQEYRNRLRDLRRGARVPTVGGRAEVEAYFAELRDLGKIWMKDPYNRVKYDIGKADKVVSAIPPAGALLAQILPDRAKEALGTLFASPDLVHLFISRWFRTERKTEDLVR